jgi:hypothetical protein
VQNLTGLDDNAVLDDRKKRRDEARDERVIGLSFFIFVVQDYKI